MSDNMFEPLAESLVNCWKILKGSLCNITGNKNVDFEQLFINTRLCIGEGEKRIYPKEKEYLIEEDEFSTKYLFSVPIGISIEDFEKRRDKFAHLLCVNNNDLRFSRVGYDIELKVIDKIPKAIYDPEKHTVKGFKIPIGVDLDKLSIRYFDLADPANSNIYVAGSARCGKSNLIRLISTMLIQKSIADVQVSWINIKRVDGIEFKECKNTIHYTEEQKEANDILIKNYEEMKRRYILFTKNRVKNIWDYRSRVQKMPVRVIIIEEIAIFEKDKEFHETLRLIAQQGAAAGILLLIATQLPNKDVLPNLTKQNINTTFGGKCKDSIRSDIIIEDGELHKLKGNGHMKIFDSYEYGTEIQVFWIDDDMVEGIAQNNLKRSLKQNKGATEGDTSITPGDNKNFCEQLLSPKL